MAIFPWNPQVPVPGGGGGGTTIESTVKYFVHPQVLPAQLPIHTMVHVALYEPAGNACPVFRV